MTTDASIISRALRLWVHRLPANLLFGAIAALPMLLAAFSRHAQLAGQARGILVAGPFFLSTIAAGLMMPLVQSDWHRQSQSLGTALRLGFSRWRVVVWSGLLAVALPAFLYATHTGIDAFFGPSKLHGGHFSPVNGATLGDAFRVPWAVFLVFSLQSACWLVPVAVAEGLGPIAAVRRCATFARGCWNTVLSLFVLFGLLSGTVGWAIGATVPFEAQQPTLADPRAVAMFATCSTILMSVFGMALAVAYDEICRANAQGR